MRRLRLEVRLELIETRHNRVGHPCGTRAEPLIIVCTSAERALEAICEKAKEGDIRGLSVHPI